MSILISGDFHANSRNELSLITKKSLLKKYGQDTYQNIRYHVILGDAGFLWPGNHKTDLFHYKVLANRHFPVLCVIGNHEPILGMSDIPEVNIGIGETVYQIQDEPFVAYLKRGKVYTIDGFKCLVLGGALSADKDERKPNITWWEREYWTEQEKQDLFKLLETENEFDYVLSHTGPHHMNKALFEGLPSFDSKKFHDEVAFLNDRVDEKIQVREWWCGHWHKDIFHCSQITNRAYQYLYKTTKIVTKQEDRMIVHSEHKKTEQGKTGWTEKPINESEVKIIDWIGDGEEVFWDKLTDGLLGYIDYESLKEPEQKCFEKVLVDYIIEHRLLFNGSYHQNCENGIPLIQYDNEKYYIAKTMRRWGDIMARAWAVINNKKYQSMDEFLEAANKKDKDGNKMESEKYSRGEYYNYTDFAWTLPDEIIEYEKPEKYD